MDDSATTINPRAVSVRPERKVLEFLVCPVTRGSLVYDPVRLELVSSTAKLAFPVRDGIAIMLVSEARSLAE
ncbi:Trm112 family protein [Aureimonas psammosilenae]|uniref:Trm112 family protein n=1 Tax=Aureimonas psammosilenae TaxID=2495496 RepID=UPI0012611F53|nr:Trm112 family protein [Aureimonas psammosilenae]